jgi:outer membrane protein assembly factor BamB
MRVGRASGVRGSLHGLACCLAPGALDNNVYAVSAVTGAVAWTFTTAGNVYSSPAVSADGTVVVGSNDGNVYALDGATGSVQWKYRCVCVRACVRACVCVPVPRT